MQCYSPRNVSVNWIDWQVHNKEKPSINNIRHNANISSMWYDIDTRRGHSLLIYFLSIFYLPRCTLPDFPSTHSLASLPCLPCSHRNSNVVTITLRPEVVNYIIICLILFIILKCVAFLNRPKMIKKNCFSSKVFIILYYLLYLKLRQIEHIWVLRMFWYACKKEEIFNGKKYLIIKFKYVLEHFAYFPCFVVVFCGSLLRVTFFFFRKSFREFFPTKN